MEKSSEQNIKRKTMDLKNMLHVINLTFTEYCVQKQ